MSSHIGVWPINEVKIFAWVPIHAASSHEWPSREARTFFPRAYVTSSQGGTPRPLLPEDSEGQSDPSFG